MKVLVTGSSGHLGEALVRKLTVAGTTVTGVDLKLSEFTTAVGSISDPRFVSACVRGIDVVYHAAALHKPHIATHRKQDFIDTNVSGTLALLEAAVEHGVNAFVFTSSTSVFGEALRPARGEPSVWVTENLHAIPRNIYGLTKAAAEDLCLLFHRRYGLNCIVLRTSRFFPEEDDDPRMRSGYTDENLKANEFLFRRVDIEDVVNAHLLAAGSASAIGFGKYIISATTPFTEEDLIELRRDPARIVEMRAPGFQDCYEKRGWKMLESIDRVYVNAAARRDLGWLPIYDFAFVLNKVRRGESPLSPLAESIGAKGYHDRCFEDGPYPME